MEKEVVEEVFEEFEHITDISVEPKGLVQVCLLTARWSVEEGRNGRRVGVSSSRPLLFNLVEVFP